MDGTYVQNMIFLIEGATLIGSSCTVITFCLILKVKVGMNKQKVNNKLGEAD